MFLYLTNWISRSLTVALFIALTAAQNPPVPAGPSQKLIDYFFYKCQNQTHSTAAFDKLYSDAVAFKDFLQYAFMFIPERRKTFCNSERSKLEQRMTELSYDIKPCLASEEKYLSEFMRDSFKEFLHFLCHNDGEHVTAFFRSSASQCRSALQNDNTNQVGTCFSKIFKPSSKTIKKKEVCDDLSTAEKCFAEILERQCPAYGPYKVLNKQFFQYVSKPCSGCVFSLNVLLLVASVLFSYIFTR
ncbi:uncharacterized protein [Leptinotarsa decemlineata]|uniref:uncharacterized protein n=1 Tax=Leptinotarsa decemlineata TaxID=7539 RepID=UPI000C253E9F|nr:uncharacterized protein LOC111502893 [Leptinotarsa decemlineata]